MKAKEVAQKLNSLGVDEESLRIIFGELDDSLLGYKFLDEDNCPGAPEGAAMMLMAFTDSSVLVAVNQAGRNESIVSTLNKDSNPEALTSLLCLLIGATESK